jgi:hypothetical protein
MPGYSLTLLLLPSPSSTAAPPSDVILRLLDASTSAPGWKWTSGARPSALLSPPAVLPSGRGIEQRQGVRAQDMQRFVHAVERACNALDKAEPEITKMDTVAGDGDCGLTLQRGAHGVLSHEVMISLSVSADITFLPVTQPSSRVSVPDRSLGKMSSALSSPCRKWQRRPWAAPAVHSTRKSLLLFNSPEFWPFVDP